ncbi:MAG: LuxR C-terminal-related transcriptional regulator [Firmicutes bacterium]|nr:LuxR C-terminal-related transcriptional regulator [Bacillota bacterium]
MSKTTNRLSPPAFPDSVVERPEVNRAIDDAMKKNVVFMHAPAGFGKTIAMSMWLSARKLPAAWIPLTVYDDESAVFYRYLLIALAGFDSGAAEAAKAALDNPQFSAAPFEYFFRALSSLSGENSGGIIVMDDFHLIQNPAILETLPLAVRKLSQDYKLVLLSRLNPPESFADLVLKDQIGGLSENILRFTEKQIVKLYKKFGIALSRNEAAEIEAKTAGWALGLGAELLSVKVGGTESFFSHAAGEKYINGYLRREVWDKWDAGTQEFLLRTSILEDLTPALCDRLCNCDSENLLSRLMRDSGLTVRMPDGSFRYHHILRDFLRQMVQEQALDLSGCYIASADYMLAIGKFHAALDYYMKSEDNDAIIRFLTLIVDYGATAGGVEEYINSITNSLINKLPAEILENSPQVLAPYAWASLMNGNIERFQYWLAKLLAYFDDDKKGIDPKILAAIMLLQFPNPFISLRGILEYASVKLDPAIYENLPSPSITYNFPFFHRGHRDYSDFTDEWEELVPKYITAFKGMTNGAIALNMDGVVSGLFYEQNKLPQAKEKAIELLNRLDESSHPELWFAAQMHLAAVAFAEADEESAWSIVDEARSLIECRGLYLLKNFNALITKYRLCKGDCDAAREWLSRYAAGESGQVKFYQLYQILATIRARIALGQFTAALVLLAKLEKLVTDYRRPLDRMEIHILRALVFWHDHHREDAVASMEKAVFLAQPYGFTRIFADEGAAVLPILQKLSNRLSRKQEQSDTSVFVRTILLAANESAKTYPGLTGGLADRPGGKPVRLSKQQMRMLLFLAAGKNNRQISEETGLNLNTVKAHLFKLYEKLEVNSATEAVLKSYRLGILE